jgi:SsrA-binding protein
MKVINKQAHFDYELGERVEAGVELTGAEAKSCMLGQVEMGQAQVRIRPNKFGGTEAWIWNLQIFPYKHADNAGYDPKRPRRLLLHQKEITDLNIRMRQTNRLLVPTAMYTKSDRVKVELALARGKKKYEKREAIKKREERKNGGFI